MALISFFIFSVCLALVTSGCGKRVGSPHPGPSNAPGSLAAPEGPVPDSPREINAAGQLFPQIVSASGEDPTLPESLTSNAKQALLTEGSRIHFQEVVPWSKQNHAKTGQLNPLYMVWDQDVLGSSIELAFFTADRFDALNRQSSTVLRKTAQFDAQSKRWYLPLLDLVQQDPTQAHPDELHVIELELHLKDQSVVRVSIDLRLYGPLPRLAVKAIPGLKYHEKNHYRFTQYAREGGFVVLEDQISNPTDRDFALWVKSDLNEWMSIRSRLRHRVWTGPHQMRTDYGIGNAGMHPSKLQITHSSTGKTTEMDLRQGWVKIGMAPQETIALSWVATLHPAYSVCQVPKDETKSFDFPTTREVCRHIPREGRECHNEEVITQVQQTNTHEFLNLEFGGLIRRWIRLSDVHLTLEEAMAGDQTRARWISDGGAYRMNYESGLEERPPGEPFSCQGIF